MRSRHRRLLASPLLVLALLGAGCSEDAPEEPTGTDHVEVGEVGAAFTFDDFSVAEGWSIREVERTAGMESVTSPEIRGEITNEGDEARFALFEIVFADEGDVVSRVKCSSGELEPGATGELLCPGLGQPVPEDYDQIVVQDLTLEEPPASEGA